MKRHYQIIFEAFLSFLIIINLLSLGLMTMGFIAGIKSNTVFYMGYFDLAIAFLIFLDFIFFRVRKERNINKWPFIIKNWAFILSIIPISFISFNLFHLFGFIPIIGLLGLFRIYAIIKVLTVIGRNVREYPSKTKLDYATFVLLLVFIIGSYLFLITERGVNPEVPNYESAMWFSIVSMTTTGFGDIVPVTLTGRIIGSFLILAGMGYVSLVTATLAFSFIDILRKERRKTSEIIEKRTRKYEGRIDQIVDKLDKIERKMDEMERKTQK